MVADGGDATLTPTTLTYNGTTIVFNDVGDSVILNIQYNWWMGSCFNNWNYYILIRSSQWIDTILIH